MSPYIHNVPGRLRVKIPELKNNAAMELEIQTILNLLCGIKHISINGVTGSIVIQYHTDELKHWEILNLLEDSGYLHPSKATGKNLYLHHEHSKVGEVIGRALFGWVVGKAFEESGLSILAAFI